MSPSVFTSPLVTNGTITGEVWAFDVSPYDDNTPAAYVVGTNASGEPCADWLPLSSLFLVNGAAVEAAAATAA